MTRRWQQIVVNQMEQGRRVNDIAGHAAIIRKYPGGVPSPVQQAADEGSGSWCYAAAVSLWDHLLSGRFARQTDQLVA